MWIGPSSISDISVWISMLLGDRVDEHLALERAVLEQELERLVDHRHAEDLVDHLQIGADVVGVGLSASRAISPSSWPIESAFSKLALW
jgi:hypothetical protein